MILKIDLKEIIQFFGTFQKVKKEKGHLMHWTSSGYFDTSHI